MRYGGIWTMGYAVCAEQEGNEGIYWCGKFRNKFG